MRSTTGITSKAVLLRRGGEDPRGLVLEPAPGFRLCEAGGLANDDFQPRGFRLDLRARHHVQTPDDDGAVYDRRLRAIEALARRVPRAARDPTRESRPQPVLSYLRRHNVRTPT